MTPTIALIAVSLITAGLCVAVGIMQWRINQLNAENDRERARHEVTNELLTEARNEAKVENDLRRQAEKVARLNSEEGQHNWSKEKERAENFKAELLELREKLDAVKVARDPKTGRFYSAKAKPRPTAKQMEKGLAEFDAMMGHAIEQLQGLTIR